MAEALYFEARGESTAGQFAVAEVILNRAESRRFPNTVCKVINQGTGRKHRCQFSLHVRRSGLRPWTDQRAYERMGKIAHIMLNGGPRDLTDGATFYHAKYVNPVLGALVYAHGHCGPAPLSTAAATRLSQKLKAPGFRSGSDRCAAAIAAQIVSGAPMSDKSISAFDHPEVRAKATAPEGVHDRLSLRDHIVSVEIGAFQAERDMEQRLSFDVVVEVAAPEADLGDDVDLHPVL